ncbi:hypothetical protein EYF80_007368 [Liparis tanakae]|uniref:Uncharacterized protein n=1 Tax=Liparis tanakae TaxID=230148 RepID=A0A4Z2IXM2_9TELE|nr:hypothetical protein EYF80_007368 [Liparis tanakae]
MTMLQRVKASRWMTMNGSGNSKQEERREIEDERIGTYRLRDPHLDSRATPDEKELRGPTTGQEGN